MNAATLDLRVAGIAASRQRTRRMRYASYAVVLVLVAWSIQAIVVKDTDWSRIQLSSLLDTLRRFADLDTSIVGELWQPALETVVMANARDPSSACSCRSRSRGWAPPTSRPSARPRTRSAAS